MFEGRKIVFYDGDCGFCNKTVQLILNHEKSPVIRFAPLQSDFSKHFFESQNLPQPDLSTFYFWDEKKIYSKSTGVLRLLRYLKFPFPLLRAGAVLPKGLRDLIYDFVAKRRHRLASGFCVLPTLLQRERFYK